MIFYLKQIPHCCRIIVRCMFEASVCGSIVTMSSVSHSCDGILHTAIQQDFNGLYIMPQLHQQMSSAPWVSSTIICIRNAIVCCFNCTMPTNGILYTCSLTLMNLLLSDFWLYILWLCWKNNQNSNKCSKNYIHPLRIFISFC